MTNQKQNYQLSNKRYLQPKNLVLFPTLISAEAEHIDMYNLHLITYSRHCHLSVVFYYHLLKLSLCPIFVHVSQAFTIATDLCLSWPKVLNLVTLRGFMKTPVYIRIVGKY